MPVVELNINRIRKLVSGKTTRKQILDALPFLGLDIESEIGDEIRIEYSPNSCLLYTSPSPRDRQKSRMPSSA